jgi:hypothetical protein
MGLDPRRALGSAAGRSAQTISELETRIARLENTSRGAILASGVVSQTAGAFTITTSAQDIPGMTVTLTAQVATTGVFIVTQSINDFGASIFNGTIYLNGTAVTGQTMAIGTAAAYQGTVSGTWRLSLPAGSNTIKLQGVRTGGTVCSVNSGRISYFQTRA